MNQRVKRAIAAAMSLTMVATATPVSPLYNAIQNAVSSTMMQANAEDIFEDYANKEKFSLSSIGDLNAFAEAVNSGKDFSGKTVKLANNFDMGDAEFTTPIGISYSKNFKGTFDGNNKTIKLNINQTEGGSAALFGLVEGATIRNVTVEGFVTGTLYVGGICGYAENNSNVYNCINNATVEGSSYFIGGICGEANQSDVYNCINNAAVTSSTGSYVGGICGKANQSDVYNCINIAAVSGDFYVGGIYGYEGDGNTIDKCYLLDAENKFDATYGVTEVTADQLKGATTVGETGKTVTELLNDYVNEFNSKPENAGIVLLNWEQGQNYPILKAPIQYTTIDGTNLKWTIDEGTLKIELDDTSKTGEQYAADNAIPDWTDVYTNAAPWRNDVSSIKSIEIADGVTRIGNWAFYNCNNLTTITIPASVKSIGEAAYCYDWKVQSVEFKGAMPEIGDNAFYDVGTAALIFPENDDSWKNFFADNADSISQNLLYWKDGLFKTSVYNKIEGTNLMWSLDNGRFTVDLFDKSVEDENLNAMPDYSSASPWFDYKASIKTLDIANGVTKIGESTFDTCANLESVTIPATVKNIGESAFGWCNNLKSIVFTGDEPSVNTSQYFCSFYEVGATTPVTLYYPEDNVSWGVFLEHADMEDKIDKNGVLSWAGGKFTPVAYEVIKDAEGQDTNLMWYLDDGKLTIDLIKSDETDETLNAMPDWDPEQNKAPWDSDKASINSVEIKDGVTHIGKFAFYGYNNVTELTIGNGVTTIGNFAFDNTRIESVIIPDSVTSIGETTFANNTALKSVVLGNNVETIAEGAFMGTGLTSIVIPAKATKIGHGAFCGDVNLKEIVFKGNYPEITYPSVILPDRYAFNGVGTEDSPAKLIYPKNNTTWAELLNGNTGTLKWEDGNFTPVAYEVIKDAEQNDTNLMWYLEDEGTDGKKLTIDLIDKSITDEALNTMPDWENLHNTTDNTPWYSLKESITSVEIKNGVTNIGATAFNECHNLEEATIPNTVTSIGESAFYVCTYLKSIKIPDSVTSIADWAFGGCEYAEELDLGKGVETIGKEAFAACIKLEKLTLPDSVTSIGEFAFGYWYGLKELNLGNGIKNIGDGAFAECIELESVTIPSCVKTIGDAAFLNCEKLSEITFEGSMPEFLNNPKLDEFNADAFSGVNTEENPVITLRYPKDDTTWETFLNGKEEVFDWEGGKFTAGSYLNWNNIDETALRWTISANGTLYIDKQENPSSDNFDVPAFGDNAPWKDSINKIRFVDISSSVTDVNDTSFKGFNGQAILVLENGYNGTMPDDINNSTYSSFGGGEFIYKTQLVGGSLSLDGQIGVNLSFYVNKDEGSTITINGETVDLSECEHEGDIYTYTLWVAPRDAYKDITFKTEKDSDTIVDQTYNVKEEYVDVVLEDKEHKTYSEDVYNMVSSLNLFINSSRIYFNEVGENEAAAIKTEIDTALKDLGINEIKDLGKGITNEATIANCGVEYYGSSLILNSGVKIRHYITIADEDNVANIKIKVGDTTYESDKLEKASFTSNSHDVYYFETDEFNPKDFGTNVSVTYEDTAAASGVKKIIDNYSVLTFISLSLGNEKTAEKELGTTCRAIYNYYLAADNYNKN